MFRVRNAIRCGAPDSPKMRLPKLRHTKVCRRGPPSCGTCGKSKLGITASDRRDRLRYLLCAGGPRISSPGVPGALSNGSDSQQVAPHVQSTNPVHRPPINARNSPPCQLKPLSCLTYAIIAACRFDSEFSELTSLTSITTLTPRRARRRDASIDAGRNRLFISRNSSRSSG